VVAVVLPFVALVLICMGVGFLVSGLFVFFRDLPYFYELVTFALWISSPVFYPSEIVPDNVKPFLAFNPLTRIIESLRQIVLSGDFPDLGLVAAAWLSGIILLTVGWFCFRWWKPQFMDLV
jgi:ABC-2 type transport system permease protein/lipopolysaccharide transport system permease protein